MSFSRMGVRIRHGWHHGAQKSTITGTVSDATRTSCSKLASVTLRIHADVGFILSAHTARRSPDGLTRVDDTHSGRKNKGQTRHEVFGAERSSRPGQHHCPGAAALRFAKPSRRGYTR